MAEVAAELGVPPWQLAAGGGEDYELCFCVAAEDRARVRGRACASSARWGSRWIGEVLEGPPGVTLSDERGDAVRIEGFEHRW